MQLSLQVRGLLTTRWDFSNLGEYWTAAKPESERLANHSVGYFKLRRVLDCS